MQPSAPRHKEAQRGIYETGSRSGLRDPSRPNWRQIAKAKEEKEEKDKKKKKQSQKKSKLEKEAAAKEEAWGVLTEDFKEEMRRFGTIMYDAGWRACTVGDAYHLGLNSAFQSNDLLNSPRLKQVLR